MNCRDTHPLIPSYLDGELSESQAAPLRQHLIDCSDCRTRTQAEKSLAGWFVEGGTVPPVPQGFAARVTRRAFAGDTGEGWPSRSGEISPGSMGEGRILPFVLQMTAAAAVVLIALSFGMRSVQQPVIDNLQADDRSYGEALEELEQLNEQERAEPALPADPDENPDEEDGR